MTASISLRPFTRRDLDAAVALEAATYAQPWNRQMFQEELAAPGRTYVVAERDGGIVGYAGLMVVGDEAHVSTLVVSVDERQTGVGTRLMLRLVDTAVVAGARSLTLEVRSSNQPAQALYHRFGFTAVGVRKRYYQDEDAMIMWVHDIDAPAYTALLEDIRAATGTGVGTP